MTLPHRLRRLALVPVALLALTACSGGIAADSPKDADVGEFCNAPTDPEFTASQAAAEFAKIGTPSDISDDARVGFEAYVDALDEEGDTPNSEVEEVTVSQNDEAEGTEFLEYRKTTCEAYFETNPPTAEPSAG